MSTKVTISPHGYPLENSGSLSLVHAIRGFEGRLIRWLLDQLASEGFQNLSGSMLSFLGSLDCGDNHASKLARQMGVSRQAIHKQVKEAERLGWLVTDDHETLGNQRVIRFTDEGERMMSVARSKFAQLDGILEGALAGGPAKLAAELNALDL